MTTATLDLETFKPMLAAIARTLVSKRHDLDLDDLIQVGFIAVLACAAKDDPSRGSFRAYARTRARFAMIDAIRDGGYTVRVPRNYHGESGARLTGPAADAARDMLARRVIRDSQLGEDCSLADLVIDTHPTDFPEETASMSRLNGFHPAPTADPAADPAAERTCEACNRRYKNQYVKRCYYRDCPKFKPPGGRPKGSGVSKSKAKVTPPSLSPVVALSRPAPSSYANELRVMGEIATLSADARARVVAWASSLS